MKRLTTVRQTVIGSRGEISKNRWRAAIGARFLAVAWLAGFPAVARADDADFAKSKKCMGCHAIDEKRVGPPFKAVAARYANDPGAEARLANKIRVGGSGAWGVVPMPANDQVSKPDAERLAHWVLMQK
jgi:cytochrome c